MQSNSIASAKKCPVTKCRPALPTNVSPKQGRKKGEKMNQSLMRMFLMGAAAVLCSRSAVAQCTDAWVSEGIKVVMGRPALGSGNTGECNIYRYGGGAWSSKQDLINKISIASSYRLVTAMGGKCLDTEGDGRANGTRIILWGCAEESAQYFLYRPGPSLHRIQDHLGMNRCLTIEGGVRKQGARIILYDCNGGSNQVWTYLPDGRIMAGNGSYEAAVWCMDADGGTSAVNWVPYWKQGVILWPCNTTTQPIKINQTWRTTQQSKGSAPSVFAWLLGNVNVGTVVQPLSGAAIVAGGGGNIIAAGGGNVSNPVAGGGASIVAGGGGNFVP